MASKKNKGTYKEEWKKVNGMKGVKGVDKCFDGVYKVRKAYEKSRMARQNSCYWFTNAEEGSQSSNNGGDWNRRWEVQEKQSIMWFKPSGADNWQSNIKSPATTGRIESLIHKIQKVNVRWNIMPTEPDDIAKSKIAQYIMDYIFYNSDLKEALTIWAKDTLVHGSGIARVYYQKKEREYKFAKDEGGYSEKEAKLIESGKVPYKKEKITKFEGVVIEPIPIQEFYPDPQARCIHGESYECRYVIRRRVISFDDFKSEFKNDPNVMNFDKVHPGSYYSSIDEQYSFFRPPEEILGKRSVEVLEYENQLDDEYKVVVNDMLIKDMPLPLNHKEITYHKLDCIINPHQFYGIGIPDYLMNLQGHEEVLMNMLLDRIYRSIHVITLLDSKIYGESTTNALRSNSQFVPINTNDGQPISNKVMQMQIPPVNFDAYRMLDMVKQSQTLATQVDPSQMALQETGKTATSTIINKEIVDTMLASILDNFGFTLTRVGRQIWEIIRQKWTKEKAKKVVGEKMDKYEPVARKIRVEGVKIIEDNEGISFKESNDKYEFIEIKSEYLNTTGDLDIRIAAESLEVMSKGLEIQKSREAYAQMLPNAVDPSDQGMIDSMKQRGIIPLWDARKIAEMYINANDLDPSIKLSPNHDIKQELLDAKENMERILRGETIVGIPGRSREYNLYVAKVLDELTRQVKEADEALQKITQEEMSTGAVSYDPTGKIVPSERSGQVFSILQDLQNARDKVRDHLLRSNLPSDMYEEASIQDSQPKQEQPMPQGQPPIPMPQMPGIQDVMPGMGGMPV